MKSALQLPRRCILNKTRRAVRCKIVLNCRYKALPQECRDGQLLQNTSTFAWHSNDLHHDNVHAQHLVKWQRSLTCCMWNLYVLHTMLAAAHQAAGCTGKLLLWRCAHGHHSTIYTSFCPGTYLISLISLGGIVKRTKAFNILLQWHNRANDSCNCDAEAT